MIMSELLEFNGLHRKRIKTDFQVNRLLESLDKIIEFKVVNNMLDFKTFI